VTSGSIIHIDLHKPNNKLVNVSLEHFWYMDELRTYTNAQNSPRPKFGGSHHLPLIIFTMGTTPKCHFSRDSQVRSPKIFEIGIPVTLDTHNFFYKPSIEVKSQEKL